jgi:hypothetical protein
LLQISSSKQALLRIEKSTAKKRKLETDLYTLLEMSFHPIQNRCMMKKREIEIRSENTFQYPMLSHSVSGKELGTS